MISDEVYGGQAFGSNPFVAMAEFASIVPVITLGSLGKQWVVPGWRIGWMVTCDPNGILQQSGVSFVYFLLQSNLTLFSSTNLIKFIFL